ncbi:PKD repeat protein [Bacillus pakistanensis]|uniref:PKD repeat protein n=1 Tax=Rossellomorea pakistanensis TaxID=992288 RepID=A0ABS2NF54_9BACI|nr:FixH family protein [Bacillus pakistanensis]MBM7586450.1 PKD repeat protein [Bacillus pakistanensis]
MKRFKLFGVVTILSLMIAACGTNEEKNNGSSNEGNLVPVKAELSVPEKVDKGDTVVFETVVTQGDEKVEDASEVKYEVWMEGKKKDSKMIKSEQKVDGLYTAEYKFTNDGQYQVQVHVTAREMHTMPKATVAVGNVENGGHAHDEGDDHPHEEKGNEHSHEESSVLIHFMKPDDVKVAKETKLITHVTKNDTSLSKAQVRFEIWQDGSEKHEWVTTEEMKPGEYTGTYSFSEKGEYHVQVHVENDEGVHEHTMEMITVE